MTDWSKRYQQAIAFLDDCKDKRVHIFHDSDADGIGAGFQLYHALKRLGAQVTTHTHTERHEILSRDAYEHAKEHNPERIIIADVNPTSFHTYEEFKELFPDTPTLILDHHHVENYEDEVYVHAGELNGVDGAYYCTAKLAYDLINDVGDNKNLSWLAASGIIGDKNEEYFMDVITQSLAQEGYDPKQDIYNSQVSVVNNAIQCSQAIDNESLQAYLESLRECETLKDAVALGNPHPEVVEEFERVVALADAQVGDSPVIWIPLESEYGITGWVSNAISSRHEEEIIVIVRDKGDAYTMSLRNQSGRVHLGELVAECADKAGGSGGGHRPAAGAKIPKENFEEFQESFERAVADR